MDVVNTYRLWLRYELFRGRLTEAAMRASEENLQAFIDAHRAAKPHLVAPAATGEKGLVAMTSVAEG